MVKSYISAIGAVLKNDGVKLQEDTCLLNSLTKACRLQNDIIMTRLPIYRDLLKVLLKYTTNRFAAQPYLEKLYFAMISTSYFGLLRIGEVADSPHAIRAADVQIARNKKKLLFILRSSKTHTKGDKPQLIKINSFPSDMLKQKKLFNYWPYNIL